MSTRYAYFDVSITGAQANGCPTPQDYAETRELFDDFGVRYLFIPRFKHLYELLNWRTDVIKSAL